MAIAHFNLGVVFLSLKDKEAALAQCKILKTLAPTLSSKLYEGIYADKLLVVKRN